VTADPTRVIVAGDWHGDLPWALKTIWQAKELLGEEENRVILHLGDFGIWPGHAGSRYLFEVSAALDQADAVLWFVDGNHEDHARLGAELDPDPLMPRVGSPIPIHSGSRTLGARIFWLWRGYRWEWHGRSWLACGGGVSLDRAARTEGVNWWPEEEITDEQEAAIIAAGHADVMVSHDRPSGVVHTFPNRPSWWDQRDVDRSERHEERMQRIVDAVQPAHLMHGHLHRAYSRACEFGYGPVEVTGLDESGKPGNYAVLNVKSMTWEAG
jgi:predicted phosphodiesterase